MYEIEGFFSIFSRNDPDSYTDLMKDFRIPMLASELSVEQQYLIETEYEEPVSEPKLILHNVLLNKNWNELKLDAVVLGLVEEKYLFPLELVISLSNPEKHQRLDRRILFDGSSIEDLGSDNPNAILTQAEILSHKNKDGVVALSGKFSGFKLERLRDLSVSVHLSCSFDPNGPEVEHTINLKEFPEKPKKKWRKPWLEFDRFEIDENNDEVYLEIKYYNFVKEENIDPMFVSVWVMGFEEGLGFLPLSKDIGLSGIITSNKKLLK